MIKTSLDNRTSVLAMVAVAMLMCAALFGAIAVATSSNHGSDTHHNDSNMDRYSMFFADSDNTSKVRISTYTAPVLEKVEKVNDSRIVIRGSDVADAEIVAAEKTEATEIVHEHDECLEEVAVVDYYGITCIYCGYRDSLSLEDPICKSCGGDLTTEITIMVEGGVVDENYNSFLEELQYQENEDAEGELDEIAEDLDFKYGEYVNQMPERATFTTAIVEEE